MSYCSRLGKWGIMERGSIYLCRNSVSLNWFRIVIADKCTLIFGTRSSEHLIINREQWLLGSTGFFMPSFVFPLHSIYMIGYIVASSTAFIKSWNVRFLTEFISPLRHYTISRKVADSIPDEVIVYFNLFNPSSCTMVLVFTQLVTEMSTRISLGSKSQPARKADHFAAICEPVVQKMLDSRRLTTLKTSTTCYKDCFILLLLYFITQRH
jgi:hypothetical protein